MGRGADGTAVDAGRGHDDEEAAVEAGVPGDAHALASREVLVHLGAVFHGATIRPQDSKTSWFRT